MKELPACRVILAYGNYNIGDIIRPTGVYRDWLVSNGFIERLADEDDRPRPVAQTLPGKAKAKARKKVIT